MSQYSYSVTCTECGAVDEGQVDEMTAAFAMEDHCDRCRQCGSQRVRSSWAMPRISEATLTRWSREASLSFLSQDEDIVLSEADGELLLACADHPQTLPEKRLTLARAICVRIHDGLTSEEDDRQQEARLAAAALRARPQLLDALAVDSYIGRVVAPWLHRAFDEASGQFVPE
ncbi:hypothetical protein [Tahibacter amnicola]|uniref:Uncharacterized protein n=1 Tax=Tahibacter amnicola TaxID=2976241 RepID=A0ABY6BPA9_9GAMM|nr:hypothetical protein [Tahibacter amnicola]UXI70240.1 hypothetical protein N4264_11575 [Tahibacter amnicola]